jgi:hypothetical protein
MLSIGFPGDEDDRQDDLPCCRKCGHELCQDLLEDWFCGECEPKEEANELDA